MLAALRAAVESQPYQHGDGWVRTLWGWQDVDWRVAGQAWARAMMNTTHGEVTA
jgi:hypothetical protein